MRVLLKTGSFAALVMTTAVAGALAVAVPAQARPKPSTATVVKVIDGDTIKVRSGNRTFRIQLFASEAPDEGACFYEEAQAGLRRLLPRGSTVTFFPQPNPDENGRIPVNFLARNGVEIDVVMARRGLVEVFETFEGSEELSRAAGLARSERRGLFGACSEWPLTGPAPADG